MQCVKSISLMQCRHMHNIILFCLILVQFISLWGKKKSTERMDDSKLKIFEFLRLKL